jgi:nucleoside-diphosphate-sugar epimerase
MKTALIGYTGFVGSNIADQHEFDDYYNSKNIADIEGKTYGLVVSAANRAEMWRINQDPETDKAEIAKFMKHLEKVNIKKLVLISTVGVYKNASAATEKTQIEIKGLTPYGIHRYELEEFCSSRFDTTIIRLPGLFGKGLKKNVIYDLIHDNNIDKIHCEGVYQYYNLADIWKDIETAINSNLKLVNFATEPVSTKEVASVCFEMDFDNKPVDVEPAFWDMHTVNAGSYGLSGNYIRTKQAVLDGVKEFVSKEKASI